MAGRIIDVTMQLVDKVTKPLSGITASLADSNKNWTRAGKEITSVGRDIAKVGQTMTTAITLPVVAAGTSAVTKFAEVDKTMALVKGTMGEAKFAAADLNGAMEQAAANSIYGMNDAAQAALNFARGGWDAEQAANALAPAMNLAAGSGGDLDTVSAGLMATMNAFEAEADEATNFADVFANACNNSALDVNSLAGAMSTAAPVFHAAGYTVNDAALYMGIMGDAGIEASESANALKSGLSRLLPDAQGGEKAMELFGWSILDADGKMKDTVTVQKELHDSFATLSEAEQIAAAQAIFGTNQYSKWIALINTSPEKVSKLSTELEKSGTANSLAAAMMEGFGGSIERLKSSLDVFMTSIGKPIGEILTPFIKKIQEMMDKFNALDDTQKKGIVKFAMMAAAIGPVLLGVGKLTMGIGGIVTKIGSFGAAISKAGGLMAALTGPGAIVVAVIAAIGVAIALLVTHWDEVKAAAERFFTYIEPVINFVKDQWTELGNKFKEVWENHLKPAWEQLKEKASESWTTLQPILTKIGEYAKDIFEIRFKLAIETAVEIIKFFAEVIGVVVEAVIGVLDGINEFMQGVFTGDWERCWNGVKEIFSSVWDGIKGIASAACDFIGGLVDGLVNAWNGLLTLIGKAKDESKSVPSTGSSGNFNAVGTSYFKGGTTWVHERGAEIIDLPRGSRIYPHAESLKMAYNEGRASGGSKGNITITVAKLAENIQVRSDSDIEAIAAALANKLEQTAQNIGGGELGYIY